MEVDSIHKSGIVHTQVVALSKRPESTVRDACKRVSNRQGSAPLEIIRSDDAALLSILKEMRVISAFTSRVSIITMHDAVKVIRRLDQRDLAIELDSLRMSTQLPPLRHNTADAMRVQQGSVLQASGVSGALQSAVEGHTPRPPGPPPPPPPPAAPPPPPYIFPSSIAEVFITPAQQTERYSLDKPRAELLVEIGTYQEWCLAPINTERSVRYIRAAQTTSLQQVPKMILGFLGSTSAYYQIQPADITLDMYKDPQYLARFIG